jgi:SAM-dependent methyltransferase
MGEYFIKQQSNGSAVPSALPPSLYPSYVDFDPYIDVGRLKSLHACLRDRLERRIARARDLLFHTGPFLLDGRAPDRPGPRMVYLADSARGHGLETYFDLDDTGLWRPSPEAAEFPELMDFIATLPFAATGRMLIIYDDGGRAVPAHRDHDDAGLCHEFIWLRTSFDKPFYMLEPGTGGKLYVGSHSAWFDTVNQYHGADATGGLSFSIRVDGRFSDDLRSRIRFPATGRSAAPALWAGAGMRRAECNQNRPRSVLAFDR